MDLEYVHVFFGSTNLANCLNFLGCVGGGMLSISGSELKSKELRFFFRVKFLQRSKSVKVTWPDC